MKVYVAVGIKYLKLTLHYIKMWSSSLLPHVY